MSGSSATSFQPQAHEEWIAVFDALSHPIRIKILGTLCKEKQYVSELARIINISRPLLYMHLKKLEAAGLVQGYHEISDAGKAIKYCVAQAFMLQLTPDMVARMADEITILGTVG